ncbi:hypothetical protein [Marvinbryantia formatexigens]|nr:hypothetical protein [Marvinbryantia formatexigens]UWO26156.1 hypothetical protein NQ534_06735 [Marvinbryantia formatexigens DSM 14469]SDF92809.1 hypothetical protein SAMN05660368_01610 [Marvinbryantia formatexigens]
MKHIKKTMPALILVFSGMLLAQHFPVQAGLIVEESETGKKIMEQSAEPETYAPEPDIIIKDENKKEIPAKAEYEGVSFEIESVFIGREIGDHDKDRIDFWEEEVDEQGNLLGEERYVWISLTAKNETEQEKEILINSFRLVNVSEKNVLTGTGAEMRYINPEQKLADNPSKRFHCFFAPGEEKSLEVGYILPEEPEGELYYHIGVWGTFENADCVLVHLEEK